jgi:hypothetical protein
MEDMGTNTNGKEKKKGRKKWRVIKKLKISSLISLPLIFSP